MVEWPERMEDLRPDEYLEIIIEKNPGHEGDERIIRIFPVGEDYKNIAKELMDL